MKKNDKARSLILKGISLHLKGVSLNKINDYYNSCFKKHSFTKKDISFVTYFTNVSIRHRGQIEKIIKNYIKKNLPKNVYEIKAGLIFGVAQIFFSEIPSYASVDSTVNLFENKIKKWRGFANAVLRKINEEKKDLLKFKDNLTLSIPEWLYKDWKNQYGENNTIKLLKTFQDEPCIDLRVKSKIDYWVKVLGGIKFSDLTVRLFYKGKIENIKGYQEGSWWVQDIAAQLPVKLMGKIKNKKILDLCAAPGGKTLQMLNQGAFVRAIDISKEIGRAHV